MDEKPNITLYSDMFGSSKSSNTLSHSLEASSSDDNVSKGCKISVSDAVQESSWNKRSHYLTQGIENIPQWYSLPSGGVSIEEQQRLLELEVGRLIHTSTSSAPLLFHSNGQLGAVNDSELRKLSAMAHQISINLSIIELDNVCAIMETTRSPNTMRAATHDLKSLYQRTKRWYSQQATSHDPKSLEDSAGENKLDTKLIDYTTSCVARLMMEYAKGATWSKTNLAVLGQIAVKLKFLTRDTSQQAEASICHAESVIMRLQKRDAHDPPNDGFYLDDDESMLEGYDETFEDDYIRSSQGRQKFATSALKRALDSLNLTLSSRRSLGFFQSSVRIYTAGPGRTACAVTEDGNSRVSVTSTAAHVDFCRTGLALVHENVQRLVNTPSPPAPAPSGAEPVTVSLDWPAAGTSVQTSNLKVYTMDALLSLEILLSLCVPQLGEFGEQMITCLSLGTETDGPPLRCGVPGNVSTSLAGCTIQSSGYLEQTRKMSAIYSDTLSIGQGISDTCRRGLHRDYERHRDEFQGWTIGNGSVTIKCRAYVACVLVFCIVLLAFTVLAGIVMDDPFLYSYPATVTIGAILYIAKLRWKSDWLWKDFLKGRIPCHSVSQVAAVTGVDAQVILLKLLEHARGTPFVTQGPYNSLFLCLDNSMGSKAELEGDEQGQSTSRAWLMFSGAVKMIPKPQGLTNLFSDGDDFSSAFSIDTPLQLWTLLVSGFLVLKVAGYNGEHLVCLDARKEATIDVVDRSGKNAVLSCFKPSISNDGEAPFVLLSQNRVEWTRLIGIYTGNVAFR